MLLQSLTLSHFRTYTKINFDFNSEITIIIGPNTAGKSNFLEAINLLSTGKSFRAEKDTQMISFGEQIARVTGVIGEKEETERLEVVIAQLLAFSQSRSFSKRFLLNGLAKRRIDFEGILPALLFVPSDLDIITSSPTNRRGFLDDVLELIDREYRVSQTAYLKALRQRNALLETVRETGIRNEQQFAYWDDLLIKYGSYLTRRREEFIEYCTESEKELIDFGVIYEHSFISRERLDQYRSAEIGSGVTLVGPHRDDFSVELEKNRDVRHFGSRGQQRLVVLQLKLLQLSFIEKKIGQRPLLLLDDIFSELDSEHIKNVLSVIGRQQTILTTTHREFIPKEISSYAQIISLETALGKRAKK